jgi:hypothetical protein
LLSQVSTSINREIQFKLLSRRQSCGRSDLPRV